MISFYLTYSSCFTPLRHTTINGSYYNCNIISILELIYNTNVGIINENSNLIFNNEGDDGDGKWQLMALAILLLVSSSIYDNDHTDVWLSYSYQVYCFF